MVALKMERDIAKDDWVAINVERSDSRARLVVSFLCRFQLANEVLGEV